MIETTLPSGSAAARKARSVAAGLLVLGCASCRTPEVAPPVLTLGPAAFRAEAGVTAMGKGELCLLAGAVAEAAVNVHEPTVTLTVTARRQREGPVPSLTILIGGGRGESHVIASIEAMEITERRQAPAGDQSLRLVVGGTGRSAVCVRQVALTQP